MLIDIVIKYFLDAILIFLVGMVTKYMVSKFGQDRTNEIKDAILIAMLWAEEVYGVGHGEEKWTIAWKKIIEILKKKGITLKKGEISYVQDIMKATVPEINAKIYSALPDKFKEDRIKRIGNK
jgi:hypothetical protein